MADQKTTRLHYIKTVSTTVGKIINRNTDRLALIIINQGAAQVRLSDGKDLTSSTGIPIPSGATRDFLSSEEEAMVKEEWAAVSEAGSNDLEIWEILKA